MTTMTKIDFSLFGSRIANCLRVENIQFVEQITAMSDNQLMKIDNMGRGSIKQIRAIYPIQKQNQRDAVDIILRLRDNFDVTLYGLNKEFPSLRGIVETLSLTLERLVDEAIEDVEKIES